METLSTTSNVRTETSNKLNTTSHKRRGASEMLVVDLIIGFLLSAILFPIAMTQIVSATTTLWNSSVITMFAILLPILVIVSIVYHFVRR